MVCVAREDWVRYPKGRIQAGELLIEVKGKAEKIAIVPDDFPKATLVTGTCFKLTTKEPDNRYVLAAYLTCRYGQALKDRLKTNLLVSYLAKADLYSLPVPRVSQQFRESIAAVFMECFAAQKESKLLQKEAQHILLRALDLEHWQPPEPLTYTRSSRDAFTAGRLDAEYFAPAVDSLVKRLRKDGLTIGNVAPARHERFNAADTGDFNYIEIGGVRTDGTVIAESVPHAEAPDRATWFVKTGDIVTSTVRPVRRLSALIAPEQNRYVCSSGFVVLNPKDIAAEVLLIYLRLPIVCKLMDLHTSASLYPAISEQDLLALPIPRVGNETESSIVTNVQAAQASRRRAAELLDAAKRAVEIAIEDSESAALAYLASVAADAASCDHGAHDAPPAPANRPATEPMARPPRGRGQPARRLSGEGDGIHPELDGPGKRAGGSRAGTGAADSTRPLDATRELATTAGTLSYAQVSERLAAEVADCLDELFDTQPSSIAITSEWLREIHRRIAGDLFPDWAGRWRITEVQVGTHLPPLPRQIAVHMRNFCLDLEERLRHVGDAQSIAGLLAWVDWRFQWIHPFKDFNGRVGRILLIALSYRLSLPPINPAAQGAAAQEYFSALRAADDGNLLPLQEIWLDRLSGRHLEGKP